MHWYFWLLTYVLWPCQVSQGISKRFADITKVLETIAALQARLITIDKDTEVREIIRERITKPHVLTVFVLERSKSMSTET